MSKRNGAPKAITQRLTQEELDHLQAVAEAATQCKWTIDHPYTYGHRADGKAYSWPNENWAFIRGAELYEEPDVLEGPFIATNDATHMATFDPPTVLRLLDEVRRLREALQEVLDDADDAHHRTCPRSLQARCNKKECDCAVAKARAALGEDET